MAPLGCMLSVVLIDEDSSPFNRHMSVDSVNSYNSQTSQLTAATDTVDADKKKKRKNWVCDTHWLRVEQFSYHCMLLLFKLGYFNLVNQLNWDKK